MGCGAALWVALCVAAVSCGAKSKPARGPAVEVPEPDPYEVAESETG